MRNYLLKIFMLLLCVPTLYSQNAATFQPQEIARWEKQAKNIEIITAQDCFLVISDLPI